MKKLLIIALLAITSLGANAQHPARRPQPNQFRDFVNFKIMEEKPQIEHKDGKVIIVMSEERFQLMQQMKQRQPMTRRRMPMNKFMMMNRPPRQVCPCEEKKEEKRLYYRR